MKQKLIYSIIILMLIKLVVIINGNFYIKQTLISDQNITCMKVINNELIAIGLDTGSISIWNIKNGNITKELSNHDKKINSLEYLSNGTLVSASDDNNIIFWDIKHIKSSKLIHIYDQKGNREDFNEINSVKVLKDGILIERNYAKKSSSKQYTMHLWNNSIITRRIAPYKQSYFKLLKDGTLLIDEYSNSFYMNIYSLNTIKIDLEFELKDSDGINLLKELRDGRLLSFYKTGDILLWNYTINYTDLNRRSKYIELAIKNKMDCKPTSILLLDEETLVGGYEDGSIIFWDIKTANNIQTFKAHNGTVISIELLENNLFVSVSEDKTIKIWSNITTSTTSTSTTSSTTSTPSTSSTTSTTLTTTTSTRSTTSSTSTLTTTITTSTITSTTTTSTSTTTTTTITTTTTFTEKLLPIKQFPYLNVVLLFICVIIIILAVIICICSKFKRKSKIQVTDLDLLKKKNITIINQI